MGSPPERDAGRDGSGLLFGSPAFSSVGHFAAFTEPHRHAFHAGMEQQSFRRFGPGYQVMDGVYQATRRLAFQHPRASSTVTDLRAQLTLKHVERAGHRVDLSVQAFVDGQARALHGELRLTEGVAEVERVVPSVAAMQQGFAVRIDCDREVTAGWEHMHVAGTKAYRASCACRCFSSVKPAFTTYSTAISTGRQWTIKEAVGSSQVAAFFFWPRCIGG